MCGPLVCAGTVGRYRCSRRLKAAAPGGQDPPVIACPVCQQPDSMRCLDAREPKGFFTDLAPEDFEGVFEWSPRSTRPTLSIATQIQPVTIPTTNVGVASPQDPPGDLLGNDKDGQGGFDFQVATVYGTRIPDAYASLEQNAPDVTVGGSSYRIATLATANGRTDHGLCCARSWHRREPRDSRRTCCLDLIGLLPPHRRGGRTDVDTLELEAGFVYGPPCQPLAQAFLCDKRMARVTAGGSPNPLTSSASLLNRTPTRLELGRTLGSPPLMPTSAIHCNLCLRDFYNLPYHGLLDCACRRHG